MPEHNPKSGFVRVLLTLVVCLVLLGAAAATSWLIFESEPTAEREGATRTSAALVETVRVERGTYRPTLRVLGRLEPAQEVELSARVPGRVVALEPALSPGNLVAAGEPLLRIDPVDFEHAVAIRAAELRQIQADLAIEEGLQVVARQEFELLGADLPDGDRSLVLREPQIERLRAQVAAAEAELRRAELDLARTTITAPFDAQVLERNVNVGSQIGTGMQLAHLVGIDEYWLLATVPLGDLQWLRFADAGDARSRVRLRHTTAWPADTWRTGQLERLVGTVDQETRLARVLVSIPDPLARSTPGAPALVLGTLLQAELEGRPLENVVRIDRKLLRKDDTVWLLEDGALAIRSVDVVYKSGEHAFVTAGLESGDEVVETDLASVVPGLALRRTKDTP